jgi:hypothetical protein
MLFALLLGLVASVCPPDSLPKPESLVQPGDVVLKNDTKLTGPVMGIVNARISASGALTGATIYMSTNNMHLDQAMLHAAVLTVYAPAIANCNAVDGTYLYRYKFVPYTGDFDKATAGFASYLNALVSGALSADQTAQLAPALTTTDQLHEAQAYLSTLGAYQSLAFMGDDVVKGLHFYNFTAAFERGKPVVTFVVDANRRVVGFHVETRVDKP